MTKKDFCVDDFKKVLCEIFDVEDELDNDTNLELYIKDSIDLGELIAILKERHDVSPRDLDKFNENTRLIEVFNNFK